MGIAGALAALIVAGPINLINVRGGNALTLPAARHLVRLDPQNGKPATWLLATQQDGADGHWLSFYRSDDEAQSFSWYAPIQDNCCERDTPDMLAVGMDIALVYSYEGPTIGGSTDHNVYFQWWRWNGNRDWVAQAPVKVFDSGSNSTAYLRGEIARDSKARLWIWAQRLNSDGTFTMAMTVSTDGGASFQPQPALDSFTDRPGGRIVAVAGNQLMLLYGTHGPGPGYMRMRSDAEPVDSWSDRQVVLSEGLYHGAALSAAGDGSGGVHLAYKDHNEQLWYRHWSGSWSDRQLIESNADWALQPAITRVGRDLVIFWNRVISSSSNYQFYYRILDSGSLGPEQRLDDSGGFKGYPAAAEVLPTSVPAVPCFYGNTPDANSGGSIAEVFAPTPNPTPPPPPPDAGVPDAGIPDAGIPDAGIPDAGTPDAGTPDAGTPDAGTVGTLFSDNFNRTDASGLGSAWQVKAGAWVDDGQRANSDRHGTPDQASVVKLSCADCSVQARVLNFGATTAALDLREAASGDRYDVALLRSGRLQIRRHNGSSTTVLADVASGITDLGNWATIALSASGAKPVQLVASVNGVPKISVTDGSAGAIPAAGTAGLWTDLAGIWFDDFVVTGYSNSGGTADAGTPDAGAPDAGAPDAGAPDAGAPDAGSPDARAPDAGSPDAGSPDAGTPDAGTLDAGAPDAGTPDAGTPDAGTLDAGAPDAGAPDAGTPDAGAPDAGTIGTIFSDNFNRTLAGDLGPDWTIAAGNWRDDGASANSDSSTLDRATVATAACADCRIDAKMVNFAGGESMLELRVAGGNRYALALTAAGQLEIRRYAGDSVSVLGSVASGIADLGNSNDFSFAVQGAFPVTMLASVNGVPKLNASDSTSGAYTGAGGAGIAATTSGILFDDFTLTGTVPGGGTPDAGTPDAGVVDAGTPDAGTPDAGPPDAGSGGPALAVQTTWQSVDFDLLAVDASGTAFGINLNSDPSRIYASSDGRNWSARGSANGSFSMLTALSDGTLLADLAETSGHVLARSIDHGNTWTDTLLTGTYRTLSPHSFAELDGAAYFVEYQVFTVDSTPIRLWKSTDDGASWSVRYTFEGHRHGHGLMPDPARHALFAFFGDHSWQSGLYRSTDGGASWTLVNGGTQAGDIVDGVVLSDGSFLCGQDVSYQGSTPNLPQIARIGPDGSETDFVTLPSASYSTHAVRSTGGFVVGTTHEEGADVEPPGWTNGTLWGSGDGMQWQQLVTIAQAQAGDDVRTDVYWELPTGELVLNVRNARGFGPGGRGYLLLLPNRPP